MHTDNKELLERLFQLSWLLRRYHMRRFRDRGPMAAPHRGQGRILSLLKLKPEMSQKELASILDIRAQSLGELLAKLEKAGLITRTPSEADRRVMDVRLTDAGREAAEQPEEPEGLDGMFAKLSAEEQASFADYLGRMTEYLEEHMGHADGEGFGGGPDFEHGHDHGFHRFHHRGGSGHHFHGEEHGFGPRHGMRG